jgi:hypothetical protein
LKLIASKLNNVLADAASASKRTPSDDDDVPVPSLETIKKLEELATNKLAEIVRQYKSGKKAWTGFNEAEIIAARELLDRDNNTER